MKTYSELITLPTFRDRFVYLKLNSSVGFETFGNRRYLNQKFYTSREWRQLRHEIIARDLGRDLGVEGYELKDHIIIHHLNPLTLDDVLERRDCLFDPENCICVSEKTHNAIHYGSMQMLTSTGLVERKPGDTKLW